MTARKRRLWKALLITMVLLVPALLWLALGQRGLIRLYSSEMERQDYLNRIEALSRENQVLIEEVERLRSDLQYIESVARKELRLVGRDDVIYRLQDELPDTGSSNPIPGHEPQEEVPNESDHR